MASRKSNVVLTIEQRQAIIGELESGVAVSTIAAIYNVHQKTIRRIGQDAARINRLVDSDGKHKESKRLKKPVYEDLDNEMYTWFVERRAMGVIITDALLREKAAEVANNLQLPTFRASRGWAKKFKKRHNVRLLKLHGEKESAENIDDINDSDEEMNIISDQGEARPSGQTQEELDEMKYLHERMKHLCVTYPPFIQELYGLLRRYHSGECDIETMQRRELGHSSHQ